jgi:hypothetical protein
LQQLPGYGEGFREAWHGCELRYVHNRLFLGGYLEVKSGQSDIFDLAINDAVIPVTGILPVFNDLANISAFLQEDVAR